MGKVSVFIYITMAVLLLLLVSHSPKKPPNNRHRRLKLRSNFTFSPRTQNVHHEPIPFDPIVADIELRREDRQWEKQYIEHSHPELVHQDSAPGHESQPEWEDFMDAEDYLNDEEKFNVTNRLVVLFPSIDVDPTDGFVTEHELTEWTLQQAAREVFHRTQRELDVHDKNNDGFISFAEYDPPSWVHNTENTSFAYDMGWWKEGHFNASDGDGDGLLNITEFNDFLHPADTKNPKLLHWLCKEEIRERDTDKDGKVNFKEFFHGLFDMVRNYDEVHNASHGDEVHNASHHDEVHNASHHDEVHNASHHDDLLEVPAKKLFAELDKDGDGYLSDVELLPVIGKLHPSERYYAKQQADYIISQADADKDGRLSLQEMIDNPYVFYSAIFSDDDDDEEFHDEFR